MIAINNNLIDDLKASGGLHQVSLRDSSRAALDSRHSASQASRGVSAQSFYLLLSDLLLSDLLLANLLLANLLLSDLSSQGLGVFAQGLGSLRLDSNLSLGARPMVPTRRECF